LDADLLDGTSSAGFATSGHNHSGVYATVGHNHSGTYCTGYAGTSGSAANLVHATNKSRYLKSSGVEFKRRIEPILKSDALPLEVTEPRGRWQRSNPVLDLTPVWALHKEDERRGRRLPHATLIAQEVQRILPEAYTATDVELPNSAGELQQTTIPSVDYDVITSALLAKVKEQEARISALEAA